MASQRKNSLAPRLILLITGLCVLSGWGVETSWAQRAGARGPARRKEPVKNPASPADIAHPLGATVPKEVPAADRGAASIVYFYYGDSKYTTLGQETLHLK